MSTTSDMWNRALDGEGDRIGDEMLRALLTMDGSIQNGGMANARADMLDDGEIAAGIEAFAQL